jgi:hypothetical protein
VTALSGAWPLHGGLWLPPAEGGVDGLLDDRGHGVQISGGDMVIVQVDPVSPVELSNASWKSRYIDSLNAPGRPLILKSLSNLSKDGVLFSSPYSASAQLVATTPPRATCHLVTASGVPGAHRRFCRVRRPLRGAGLEARRRDRPDHLHRLVAMAHPLGANTSDRIDSAGAIRLAVEEGRAQRGGVRPAAGCHDHELRLPHEGEPTVAHRYIRPAGWRTVQCRLRHRYSRPHRTYSEVVGPSSSASGEAGYAATSPPAGWTRVDTHPAGGCREAQPGGGLLRRARIAVFRERGHGASRNGGY